MPTTRRTDCTAESLSSLPPELLEKALASLSPEDAEAILYDWRFWARPEQIAPAGDWSNWLCLAGRGWGKTRVGAEWVKDQVHVHHRKRIALIGPTAADIRDTMIEGESGILSLYPEGKGPLWQPSKRRLTWGNGARAFCFSAEEPERLRGPQFEAGWCDELAAWKYPQEAWDNYQFGLRLGADPQTCITTTPKNLPTVREIIADLATVVTRGSTYDNIANLAPKFIKRVRDRYEGTRLGRQELYAELLEDVEGALWRREWIERARVRQIELRALKRIVVAIDPAVTAKAGSDETGIVVAGEGHDGRAYVLDDQSCLLSPDGWAQKSVNAYRQWRADRIIGEVNNGGDLVERILRQVDKRIPYRAVYASRGKLARAEPVAAMYEQGKVSHVGTFAKLEDEQCNYTGAPSDLSPNRLDAVVWALSELFVENTTAPPKAMWM